ncbi:hypothetical protein DPMN_176101 [Dreissena polymorpha]|uniref:Uncharacterized protein n=1 Tax=Dreissena polymorpha TaxID=45954 RepID=A0A9D4IHT7_DREPO|nr:hypothetical protein DPMN_176101 [Dreissena polymorpha]
MNADDIPSPYLHKYYMSLKKFSAKTSSVSIARISTPPPMLATSTLPTVEPY